MFFFFFKPERSPISTGLLLVLLWLLSLVLSFRPVGGYLMLLAWSFSVFVCLLTLNKSMSRSGRENEFFFSDPTIFSLSVFSFIGLAGVFFSILPDPVGSLFLGYSPPLYQLSLVCSSFFVFGSGFILPGFAREDFLLRLQVRRLLFGVRVAIQIFMMSFVLITSFHIIVFSHLNYSSLRPVAGLLMTAILGLLLLYDFFPVSGKISIIVLFLALFGQTVLISSVPGFESLAVMLAVFFWAASCCSRIAPGVVSYLGKFREKNHVSESARFKFNLLLSCAAIFLLLLLFLSVVVVVSEPLLSSLSFVLVKYIAAISDPLSYPRLSSISYVSDYLLSSGLVFGSASDSWNHLLSHNSFLDVAARQGFLPAVSLFSFYLFALRQTFRRVAENRVFPFLIVLLIFLYANIQPFLVSDGYGVVISFLVLGLACSPSCRHCV